MPAENKVPKSEQTRAKILQAALALFRERGFDETTMRDIAAKADMSLGSTYYYFETKENLVFQFYADSCQEFAKRPQDQIAATKSFEKRLRGVLEERIAHLLPSRNSFGALARAALDPSSPLSPFSPETKEVRDGAIKIFDAVIENSDLKLPESFRSHVAKLLWLYHLGIVLYWIYDRSLGQKKTKILLDRSLALIVRALKLAGMPLIRSLVKPVFKMMDELEEAGS